MIKTIRSNGKAYSVPSGIAIAGLLSMLITVMLSAVIAGSLNTEKMTWEQAGYWIMAMLFTASYIGSKYAIITIKRQRFAVSAMLGLLYWGMLLCITALFFGGNYGAIWETAGLIGAGCGTAALLSVPTGKKSNRKTRRVYR